MQARAAAKGIPHFHIFGEVYTEDFNPAQLARRTRVDGLPAVLDFGFALAVRATVAGSTGTACLGWPFSDDAFCEGAAAAAPPPPTVIRNHHQRRCRLFP